MQTLYQALLLWLETKRYDRSRLTAPCQGCGQPTNLIWCEVC